MTARDLLAAVAALVRHGQHAHIDALLPEIDAHLALPHNRRNWATCKRHDCGDLARVEGLCSGHFEQRQARNLAAVKR